MGAAVDGRKPLRRAGRTARRLRRGPARLHPAAGLGRTIRRPTTRPGAPSIARQSALLPRHAAAAFRDGPGAAGLRRRRAGFRAASARLRRRDRLVPGGGARADPGRRLLRPSRRPPLPGHPLDPPAGGAGLHRRARHLPRRLRPCAAADPAGFRRFPRSLWPARRPGRADRRAEAAGAALLAHGGIRPDPRGRRDPRLWRRHPLLLRRDAACDRGQRAAPAALRGAARAAQRVLHRRPAADLFRHRRFLRAVRRHARPAGAAGQAARDAAADPARCRRAR